MGWLKRAASSLENPRVSLNDPDAFDDLGLSHRSLSGARVNQKRALGYPPLWRGINLIANCCRKLRPYVYRNTAKGPERDKAHPAYLLLRRKANPFLKSGILRQTLTFHAVLFGNGYALIVRDTLGQPKQLIPLSPFDTFPVQMNGAVWYVTTVNGERRKLPAADLLHIHGLSFNGLHGLSVIELMADALGLGISARDYAGRFFLQGANASGILMIPGHLKPDAVKEAMKDFASIATGVANQHKVGLLQDGVKWQPMTINAQESQLLESRQFEGREVANILGLPPHKLGDGSRTSYNSLEMENQAYLDDSIDPWLVGWEEEYEDKLLLPEQIVAESHYIEFNRAALLRTDQRTRTQIYASARQWGWLNVNEIRRKENEPPIGEQGDIYLQPGNMGAAGGKPTTPPADPPADPPPDAEEAKRAAAVEACWAAIRERCQRFHKIEVDQTTSAAKRGGDLAAWVNTWWEQQGERLKAGLQPEVRILSVLNGRNLSATFGAAVDLYVSRARHDVISMIQDGGELGKVVQGWGPERFEECFKICEDDNGA